MLHRMAPCALLLLPLAAAADTEAPATPTASRAESRDVHDPQRPFKLGSRAGAWTGPYSAPAVGGHIKIAASEAVGLEGFMDHTLVVASGVARHDHVIGFSAYTPKLLGNEWSYISPTIGACVDFRVDTPFADRLPSNTDVLFGAHAGAMAEMALGRGWSLELDALAFAYVGNAIGTGDWTAGASNKLHTSAVGQFLGSINYRL
ncbi:MAG: hypothetical protein H6737_08220 [Alphaproteobacteria bacterium]|nr:hypothetical protein [Alphaproteobacteria bacterium]